jgi:hypothetical protein
MVFNLGGFVPRKFNQFSKDPFWAMLSFSLGYWFGEYYFLNRKLNSGAVVYDPKRYMYSPKTDH